MWGRYHLDDPNDFYEAAGAWVVSLDPGDDLENAPTAIATSTGFVTFASGQRTSSLRPKCSSRTKTRFRSNVLSSQDQAMIADNNSRLSWSHRSPNKDKEIYLLHRPWS